MSRKRQYTMLAVQRLPHAGLLVRFRVRRLVQDRHLQQARQEFDTLVAPERLLLIDLTNVEQLSSDAIGLLIRLHGTLKKLAGNLSLCGLRPEIDDVFRICRLDQRIDIYRDLESALGEGAAD